MTIAEGILVGLNKRLDADEFMERLARVLQVDVDMLIALALDLTEIPVVGVCAYHQAGGYTWLTTLKDWDQTSNEVDDAGGPVAWRAVHPLVDLPIPRPRRTPVRGFFVYRLFDAHERLLYVGSTVALRRRLRSHRRRWPNLIGRVTWEEFNDETSMLGAERYAIAEELPAFNIIGV